MLSSLSPIDGRYNKFTKPLSQFFSEQALMRYRIIVEGAYLIALSQVKGIKMRRPSPREIGIIRKLYNLSLHDAQIISDIETKGYKQIKATDHDVKAVEYYLKDKLSNTSLKNVLEWIHFGLTSYDINTPARGLMLKDALNQIIIPKIVAIFQNIDRLAKKYKNLPMLARTHGQPASPTTFGKEMRVFAARLEKRLKELEDAKIEAKLNGATGNWNAHVAAYPKVNWPKFSQEFLRKLNLVPNLVTTQIECHDSWIVVFDILRQINTILIDFNQDIWRYISDEWVGQKSKAGEVGSSTMPHKINPIFFENSE